MRSLLLAFAFALAGLPAAAAVAADEAPPRIYRWVDENGIAHYTTDPERIPRSLRRRFGLPAEPLREEPIEARAPATPPPPESAPDAWAAQEKGAAPPPPAAPPTPSLTGAAPTGGAEGEWREGSPTDVASAASSAERLAQLELRIAELSAAIAADEDVLASWIGDPNQTDAVELGGRPEFREIALRLPERIEELEALQKERDALRSALP